MTNTAKARGTFHETHVRKWLQAHGWPYAKRLTMKGSADEGDISLGDGIPVMVEAKNRKTWTPGAFIKEMDAEVVNVNAKTGVVIIKRRGTTDVGQYYALTTVDHWNALVLAVYKDRRPKRRLRRVERTTDTA